METLIKFQLIRKLRNMKKIPLALLNLLLIAAPSISEMKRSLVSAFCCLLALGLTPNLPAQTFSDSNWISLGSGVNGPVYALAVSGSNLYVGGSFTTAGGVPATNIALWNGSYWTNLGSGISLGGYNPGGNGVFALALSGTNLYAGGGFVMAGGIPAANIAQWNGSSWSALGSGVTGSEFGPIVHALAVSGTNLYAGGTFAAPGNNVAQWNGSYWTNVGSGLNGGADPVLALAVSGSNLYAGGNFVGAGGERELVAFIAQWNGSLWTSVGSSSGPGNQVNALASSGSNLYAGSIGAFTNGGGATAEWNGTYWTNVGSGPPNLVRALAVSGNSLYAGGWFTNAGAVPASCIAQWNGSAWSNLSSGMNNQVYALAVSGNNLFVGGAFTMAGTNAVGYVAEAILPVPLAILTTDGNFGFTNGGSSFGFDVSGSAGQTLMVQGSSDLTNWISLQTNVLSNSVWYFSDSTASNFTARYYRATLVQ